MVAVPSTYSKTKEKDLISHGFKIALSRVVYSSGETVNKSTCINYEHWWRWLGLVWIKKDPSKKPIIKAFKVGFLTIFVWYVSRK